MRTEWLCIACVFSMAAAVKSEAAAGTNKTEVIVRDATDAEIELSKMALRSDLKDADSAKFMSVKVADSKTNRTVCGLVNAKNSYGAYSGYSAFEVIIMPGKGGKPFSTVIALDEDRGGVAEIVCRQRKLL